MVMPSALLFATLFSIEAIPPPPPLPLPVARAEPIKAAIDDAYECLLGPTGSSDYSGERAADRATRRLKVPIGSAEWNRARDQVISFAQRRQEQRLCLDRLEAFGREASMTDQD